MANLERAIQIAHEAHDGQTRYDGRPYVVHPLRVMGRVAAAGFSEATQIAAVLHDVVEDNPDWTIERLREEGFEEDVLDALDLLDKKDTDENEYIDKIAENDIARPVKKADMDDNLDDDPTDRQVQKYVRRLARLATTAAKVKVGTQRAS
ncbi:MAG TPA: HD domain-containing protein [Candidatus Saccharimonadales bacterium]